MEFQASAERVFFKGNQYFSKGSNAFKTSLALIVKGNTCCLYQNFVKIRKSFWWWLQPGILNILFIAASGVWYSRCTHLTWHSDTIEIKTDVMWHETSMTDLGLFSPLLTECGVSLLKLVSRGFPDSSCIPSVKGAGGNPRVPSTVSWCSFLSCTRRKPSCCRGEKQRLGTWKSRGLNPSEDG